MGKRLRGLARLAGLVVALALVPVSALAERIALIVGNARYEHVASLATPAEDTRAVAEALRRLDFEVTLLSDVSTDIFDAVLTAFAAKAQGAEAVMFYYAGHAYQEQDVNRLVPVSARLDGSVPLADETWSMNDIAARISGPGTTLIFLDACRTNPVPEALRGPGVAAQGLAEFDTATGTFVAFSTSPGGVSYDQAEGPYSPFARAFLDHVERPGLSVSDLMIRVRNEVEVATVGRQVPWDQSSLRAQFHFAGAGTATGLADAGAVQDAGTVAAPGAEIGLDDLLDDVVSDPTVTIDPAPGGGGVDVAGPAAPPPAAAGTQMASNDPPPKRIQSIAGGKAAVSGGVTSDTRAASGATRLAPVDDATRVGSTSGGTDSAGSGPEPAPAGGADGPSLRGLLARAVQAELVRLGCLVQAADGQWGPASRAAVIRYAASSGAILPGGGTEPTDALLQALQSAPRASCVPANRATAVAGQAVPPAMSARPVAARVVPPAAHGAASAPVRPTAAQQVVRVPAIALVGQEVAAVAVAPVMPAAAAIAPLAPPPIPPAPVVAVPQPATPPVADPPAVVVPLPDVTAPGAGSYAPAGAEPGDAVAAIPTADRLPFALQEDLKRVGCYRSAIDGDWGKGSRAAAGRYYEARNLPVPDGGLEPTEALWHSLQTETGQVCAPPAAQPAAARAAPPKPGVKKKPQKTKAAAPKAPAAPAPVKRKPKCKFVVVAVVCK